MSQRLLVLAWHSVQPTWHYQLHSPEASRRGFERQVRLLRRWANVIPLRAGLEHLAAGRRMPPRAVALTFDDGYLNQVRVAAPLLKDAGLPATFFLVRDFLSGDTGAWWEEVAWAFARATAAEVRWDDRRYDTSGPALRRAAWLAVSEALKGLDVQHRWEAVAELRARLAPEGPAPGRQFMDWDEARQLHDLGHDIGSHTCRHPILSREESTVQARELADSRTALETHFGRGVELLAIPNGRVPDYSAETLRLARDVGYAFALTTRPALADAQTPRTEIPRVVLMPEDDLREVVGRAARGARRALSVSLSGRLSTVPVQRSRRRRSGDTEPVRAHGDPHPRPSLPT